MTAPGSWSYAVTVPSSDLTPPGTGATTAVGSGTLNFNGGGMLTSSQATGDFRHNAAVGRSHYSIPPTGTTFADGAAPMSVNWALQTAGNPTITQTASASGTSATTTDGFASGTLCNLYCST